MGRITRLFNFAGLPPSDGLIAAWNLEDATDDFSTNDLTNNNACTFVAGKISNAVNLDGVNQYLSIADNAALSFGTGQRQTICGWFKLDTIPGAGVIYPIVAKWNVTTAQREYRVFVNENASLRYTVTSDGVAQTEIGTANGAIAVGVWYFFVVWYDGAKIYLEVNNSGTFISSAYSGDIFNGTAEFQIGRTVGGVTGFTDGLIDAVRIYKSTERVLTANERSALYNNSNGRQYVLSTTISSDEVNRELNQIINLLIGNSVDISLIFGEYNTGTTDSMITVNQNGMGPILQCYQSNVLKLEINNSGQIKSYVATGTAPITISTTALNANLNADLLDGLDATAFLQVNSYLPVVDSVFYDGTPASGDRKLINPQGNRLLSIIAQQRGTASTNAITIISVKKDNQAETVLGSITLTGNSQAVFTSDITDVDIDDRVIFEITSIIGTTKHSDITVGVVTRQLPI